MIPCGSGESKYHATPETLGSAEADRSFRITVIILCMTDVFYSLACVPLRSLN